MAETEGSTDFVVENPMTSSTHGVTCVSCGRFMAYLGHDKWRCKRCGYMLCCSDTL